MDSEGETTSEVIGQSSFQTIQQPLPKLLIGQNKTKSDSRHRLWFCGNLGIWEDFFTQVRKTIDHAKIDTKDTPSARHRDPEKNPYCTSNEQYFCGDELSGDQHPVRDFKITEEGQSDRTTDSGGSVRTLPDFAAVQEFPQSGPKSSSEIAFHKLRFIGEAKTPWVDKHTQALIADKSHIHGTRDGTNPLRQSLGQIAAYMYDYKLKFGFLTTYRHTVFLKQEFHKSSKEYRLYVSDAIHASATPRDGKSKVSLRECLLFISIATTTGSEYHCDNPMKRHHWVQGNASLNKTLASPDKSTPKNYLKGLRTPPESVPDIAATDPVEVVVDAEGRCTGTFSFALSEVVGRTTQNPSITINGRQHFLRFTEPAQRPPPSFAQRGGRLPMRPTRPVSPSPRVQDSQRHESHSRSARSERSSSSGSGQEGVPLQDPHSLLRQGAPSRPTGSDRRRLQEGSPQRPVVSSRTSSNSGSDRDMPHRSQHQGGLHQSGSPQRPAMGSRTSSNSGAERAYDLPHRPYPQGTRQRVGLQQEPPQQRQLRSSTRRQQQELNPSGQAGEQSTQGGNGQGGQGGQGRLRDLFKPSKDKHTGDGK